MALQRNSEYAANDLSKESPPRPLGPALAWFAWAREPGQVSIGDSNRRIGVRRGATGAVHPRHNSTRAYGRNFVSRM